jgi:hypothetical protein
MPTVGVVGAVLLYLVPVAVLLACRARRGRALSALALDVPTAVALEPTLVLSLASSLRLEVATQVSRVLWLAGGAVVVARRPDPPHTNIWTELIFLVAGFSVLLMRFQSESCTVSASSTRLPPSAGSMALSFVPSAESAVLCSLVESL